MPTPTKPFTVLKSEKKSHRTKAELKLREQGEEALSTGVALKERTSVKNNPAAHKEFKRVNGLLKNIAKNDAIFEPVINRYCLMQAECNELEERREFFFNLIQKLEIEFDKSIEKSNPEDIAKTILSFAREIRKLTDGMMSIDALLQSKRKMLLDLEKENIMTIAAALRSIPKKEDKKSNKLLEALNGD